MKKDLIKQHNENLIKLKEVLDKNGIHCDTDELVINSLSKIFNAKKIVRNAYNKMIEICNNNYDKVNNENEKLFTAKTQVKAFLKRYEDLKEVHNKLKQMCETLKRPNDIRECVEMYCSHNSSDKEFKASKKTHENFDYNIMLAKLYYFYNCFSKMMHYTWNLKKDEDCYDKALFKERYGEHIFADYDFDDDSSEDFEKYKHSAETLKALVDYVEKIKQLKTIIENEKSLIEQLDDKKLISQLDKLKQIEDYKVENIPEELVVKKLQLSDALNLYSCSNVCNAFIDYFKINSIEKCNVSMTKEQGISSNTQIIQRENDKFDILVSESMDLYLGDAGKMSLYPEETKQWKKEFIDKCNANGEEFYNYYYENSDATPYGGSAYGCSSSSDSSSCSSDGGCWDSATLINTILH